MIKTFCDRCGEEAPVTNVTLPNPRHRSGFPHSEVVQLCEECQYEVLIFACTPKQATSTTEKG